MKTILELLIRLHELRCCCSRVLRKPEPKRKRKLADCVHKKLVRECLPTEVLANYDQMMKTERSLCAYSEVFAMAVLVATFRGLTPAGRRKLAAHFATSSPTRLVGRGNGEQNLQPGVRRCKGASMSRLNEEKWPR